MGVKVVTSDYDPKEGNNYEVHMYEAATTWELVPYGNGSSIYLQVIEEPDEGEPRVVALFSQFERVEAVDDPVDEDD